MNASPLASHEWAGFVAAIRWQPGEDMPRLAAADWLTDAGLPELDAWADFIRLQVAAARLPRPNHVYTESCDCKRCRSERTTTRLFDQWGHHWYHHTIAGSEIDLQKVQTAWPGDYVRGFLMTIRADIEGYKVAHVPKMIPPLFTAQPIRVAIVKLHAQQTYAYYRPREEWSLTINVFARESVPPRHSEYLSVRAFLSRPHNVTNPIGPVLSQRIVSKPHQFSRSIRAVAAEVIRRRREWGRPHLRETGSLRRSLP